MKYIENQRLPKLAEKEIPPGEKNLFNWLFVSPCYPWNHKRYIHPNIILPKLFKCVQNMQWDQKQRWKYNVKMKQGLWQPNNILIIKWIGRYFTRMVSSCMCLCVFLAFHLISFYVGWNQEVPKSTVLDAFDHTETSVIWAQSYTQLPIFILAW